MQERSKGIKRPAKVVFILFFFLLVFVSFFVLVFSPGLLGCQLLELLLFHIKYSALFCALTAYKKKWSCGVVFDFFPFFFLKKAVGKIRPWVSCSLSRGGGGVFLDLFCHKQ